jgi:hypothetical protein
VPVINECFYGQPGVLGLLHIRNLKCTDRRYSICSRPVSYGNTADPYSV